MSSPQSGPGPATLTWKIPLDPPGVDFTRIIRMTNIRANISSLGSATAPSYQLVQAAVAIQGDTSVPVPGGQQISSAYLIPGIEPFVISSPSIPQCAPHNAVLLGKSGTAAFDFSVQVTEGFAYAFESRDYGTALSGAEFPPALVEQNIPGFGYPTETGFYSPSLFTPAPTLGLADFGDRIRVSLGSIQAGTQLFVPTTITLTGKYGAGTPEGLLQLVRANQNGNSAAGYDPITPTATIGTTPVAKASVSGRPRTPYTKSFTPIHSFWRPPLSRLPWRFQHACRRYSDRHHFARAAWHRRHRQSDFAHPRFRMFHWPGPPIPLPLVRRLKGLRELTVGSRPEAAPLARLKARREPESRAFVRLAIHAHASAHQLDQLLARSRGRGRCLRTCA